MAQDEIRLVSRDLTLRLNRGRTRFSKGAAGIGATRDEPRGTAFRTSEWLLVSGDLKILDRYVE